MSNTLKRSRKARGISGRADADISGIERKANKVAHLCAKERRPRRARRPFVPPFAGMVIAILAVLKQGRLSAD
ncbi:hypothetical protein PO124_23515 [Bacillus licheniformis]|nr:hypothetical protein [Bacillus licheniformis]